MQDDMSISFFGAIGGFLWWVAQNIFGAFVNFAAAVSSPSLWADWLSWNNTTEDKQSLMRFVYYGGSVEFFFFVFTLFLVLTAFAIYFRGFMWGIVRALEGFANTIGRFAAWAGLLMVVQQIIIVFMQRVFARPDMSFGLGVALDKDISWYAEELKFYNALVIVFCVTYTFVQGGHVRVDLVYGGISHRAKRVVDMVGSLIFMMPVAVLTWMYGWFFLWRHLIVPKPSASDQLERLVLKARALRWNVETIGFSPSGFNGYFLFKILLVTFAGLIFLHAIAFFYRSMLEFIEGEDSEGKYLDKDTLGAGEEAYEGTH